MPVSEQTPFNEYTANGSTTVFNYSFYVIEESDLVVYDNSVEQVAGFTVESVGNPSGGTVTFSVAPTSGHTIRLVRSVPLNRTTDFQEGAGLSSITLDNDLDRLTQQIQDLDRDAFKQDLTGVWDFDGARLEDVGAPTADDDAATKEYVDNSIEAITTLITFAIQYSQITAINGTFTVLEYSPILFTIDSVRHKTDSGTVTAAVKIGGVNVGSLGSLSVTSTQGNATATAPNTVNIGDRVEIELSSVSSVTDLSISLTCSKQQA